MMEKLGKRFLQLDSWLKLIWCFCFLGFWLNALYLVRDLSGGSVLLRLHAGFLILYGGQVAFILWGERWVWVLSLLQAVLAFLTNLDFSFVPVLRLVGEAVYLIGGDLSVEGMEVYKYVFVSAALTLELLKTWMLFYGLSPRKKRTAVVSVSE